VGVSVGSRAGISGTPQAVSVTAAPASTRSTLPSRGAVKQRERPVPARIMRPVLHRLGFASPRARRAPALGTLPAMGSSGIPRGVECRGHGMGIGSP
jgi:hypothetical protein